MVPGQMFKVFQNIIVANFADDLHFTLPYFFWPGHLAEVDKKWANILAIWFAKKSTQISQYGIPNT